MNIFEQAKDAGFTVTGGRIESPYIGGSDIGQRLKEFAAIVRADVMNHVMDTCEAEYKRYDEMVEQDDAGHKEATAIIHLMRKLEKMK